MLIKLFSVIFISFVLASCSSDSETQAPAPAGDVVVTPPVDPEVPLPPDNGAGPEQPVDPTIPVTPVTPVTPLPQGTVKFENNFQGWLDVLTGNVTTVDFESVESSSRKLIDGSEFSQFAGNPRFTQIEGAGMFIGNTNDGNQIISSVSGVNTFFMGCSPRCEGIVRVDFSSPVNAFGAFFVDVEADFANTGFSLSSGPEVEFAFAASQGQNVQSHLGFTSATPFSSVFIHFSTGPSTDGALMDDMGYVLTQ